MWRLADESNAHRFPRVSSFQDWLPAIPAKLAEFGGRAVFLPHTPVKMRLV